MFLRDLPPHNSKPTQHSSRTTTITPTFAYSRKHVRLAVVLVAFTLVSFTLTFTVRRARRGSRPLVIKLHESEERFVEEAIQGVQLLPKKLKPPATVLREKCRKLYKGKCPSCPPARSKPSHAGGGSDADTGKDRHSPKLASPKDALSAQRRQWNKDKVMRSVRSLLTSDPGYRSSLDLMKRKPLPRLRNFKNHCLMTAPRNKTQCKTGAFGKWRKLAVSYERGAIMDSNGRRLSCLPYFFILGPPMSGAAGLLPALTVHPDVTFPLPLQSEWLESARFDPSCASVNTYLDFFDSSTQTIQRTAAEKNNIHTVIAGEVSERLLWDNHLWPALPGNEGQLEPRYTNADYLRHVIPGVKVVVILRNPTERLYEEYKERSALSGKSGSAEDFHSRVKDAVDELKTCLTTLPARTCVYHGLHHPADDHALVRVRPGMYAILLQDWLRAFSRDNVHVIHYESLLQRRTKIELIKLVSFLGLKDVTLNQVEEMLERFNRKGKPRNTANDDGKKDNNEDEDEDEDDDEDVKKAAEEIAKEEEERNGMLDETREMLREVYGPSNRLLAALLEDDAFLWED